MRNQLNTNIDNYCRLYQQYFINNYFEQIETNYGNKTTEIVLNTINELENDNMRSTYPEKITIKNPHIKLTYELVTEERKIIKKIILFDGKNISKKETLREKFKKKELKSKYSIDNSHHIISASCEYYDEKSGLIPKGKINLLNKFISSYKL
jgi:hypothetical protein